MSEMLSPRVAQRRKAGCSAQALTELLPSISETVLLNKSFTAVVSLLPDAYFFFAELLCGISFAVADQSRSLISRPAT